MNIMKGISLNDKNTICILGGTGFIGRYLIDELSKQNIYKVRILIRNLDNISSFPKNIQPVVGDLNRLQSIIEFLVPKSIVINLTYLKTGTKYDNFKAAKNLATACIKVGVSRLIHCSTAIVAGRTREKYITESTVCKPVTEYDRIKLSIEKYLLQELKEHCEILILRPTAVFGKNGKNLIKIADGLVNGNWLIELVKASIFSNRRMNLVCAENVVAAILFLIWFKGKDSEQCFIISDDDVEENNYYDILKILANNLGVESPRKIDFPYQPFVLSMLLHLFRKTNVPANRFYSSKKLQKLGFKKAISFHDALNKFASWYNNYKGIKNT